jgi:hypothetical protein
MALFNSLTGSNDNGLSITTVSNSAALNKDPLSFFEFYIFEARPRKLRHYIDSQKPRGIRQLWNEKRGSLNYYYHVLGSHHLRRLKCLPCIVLRGSGDRRCVESTRNTLMRACCTCDFSCVSIMVFQSVPGVGVSAFQ